MEKHTSLGLIEQNQIGARIMGLWKNADGTANMKYKNSHDVSLLKLFTIVLTTFLMYSCASSPPLSMSVHQLPGQTTIYNSGKSMVVSSGAVTITASSTKHKLVEKDEYLKVNLILVNTTDKSVDIIPQKIKAFGPHGNRLEILSTRQQELAVEKEHKHQRISLALGAMAAALQSDATGQHNGTISGNSYSGTSTYTDNTDKKKAVQSETAQMKADILNEKAEYLKRHTMLPSKEYFGTVWIRKPALFGTPYLLALNVPIENETHLFKIIIDR